MSAADRTRQRHWRQLGIVILVGGLLGAGAAWWRAAPDDGADQLFREGTLVSGNARKAENQMKDLGGQSNVLAGEMQDWFGRLWHGRRLAGTLAVFSLGGALASFFVAHLLNYPSAPGGPPGTDQGTGSRNE